MLIWRVSDRPDDERASVFKQMSVTTELLQETLDELCEVRVPTTFTVVFCNKKFDRLNYSRTSCTQPLLDLAVVGTQE